MSAPSQSRRAFVMSVVATGTALAASRAFAQAAVSEKDPQAAALGFVSDAVKADTKKYPKYAAGQACGACAPYQGKPGDAIGNCPLFAGRQVSAKSWCSAWSKKG